MQERNTGRGQRESDGDIAQVAKKLHFCGVEEVGLQLWEETVASLWLAGENSLLWNGCFVHLDVLQQKFRCDLTFKAALFGQKLNDFMCFYVQVFQKTGSGYFFLVSFEFVFVNV